MRAIQPAFLNRSHTPTANRRRQIVTIPPATVPENWDDNDIILFDEFCKLIQTPEPIVQEWRRCGTGPHWNRFNGNGARYTTVADIRRYLKGRVSDAHRTPDSRGIV